MIALRDTDRAFALNHVPIGQRDNVAALWAFDEQLGQVVASTTQPMVGQMRLLWWQQALEAGVRGHPILEAMTSLAPAGVDAQALGRIVDGWDVLLDPLPLDAAQLARYAALRGTQLFALSARLLGQESDELGGAGWALADFGLRCSDSVTAERALDMARDRLAAAELKVTPRPLRVLVRLARADVVARKRLIRTPWKLLRSVA